MGDHISGRLARTGTHAGPDRVRLGFVLLALTVLTLWALAVGTSVTDATTPAPQDGQGDLALYERIADRVVGGDSYYAAAVEEQAADDYPTSPPPAIRLPTTTFVSVVLGGSAVWVFRALLVGVALAALFKLENVARTRFEWIGSALLAAVGLTLFADPRAVLFADAWAVCLVALSLAVHRADRWWPSVLLGVAAVSFRELAGPYLVLMGLLAWRRRRSEALCWWLGAALFLMAYSAHWTLARDAAAQIARVDSDGWWGWGGWPYVVDTFRSSSVFSVAPYWLAALGLAGAIAGWFAAQGDYRLRVLVTSLGFMALFTVAGRPNTAYWGLLYAPVLVPGLAFLPRFVLLLCRPSHGPK